MSTAGAPPVWRRAAHTGRVAMTIGLVACIVAPLAAQAPQSAALRGTLVTVSVEPDTVRVGDPFVVRVRVRAPKNATIRFPAVPDTGDAVEALDPRAVEEGADQSVLERTAIYRLVAWDVGVRRPRFTAVVVAAAGVEQQFAVAGASVVVQSLLPADSTDNAPRDSREPLPVPSGWWRYALVGALVVAAVLWLVWRRRRTRTPVPAPAPEAFASASAAFSALDALALSDAGEPGRHVIAHVDVLRRYVARRLPEARESLTPLEFVRTLAASDLALPVQRLHLLLARDADVRYAAAGIATGDAGALGREARAIVQDIQRTIEARIREDERQRSRARRGRRAS